LQCAYWLKNTTFGYALVSLLGQEKIAPNVQGMPGVNRILHAAILRAVVHRSEITLLFAVAISLPPYSALGFASGLGVQTIGGIVRLWLRLTYKRKTEKAYGAEP
jgi:hypothetical protein